MKKNSLRKKLEKKKNKNKYTLIKIFFKFKMKKLVLEVTNNSLELFMHDLHNDDKKYIEVGNFTIFKEDILYVWYR